MYCRTAKPSAFALGGTVRRHRPSVDKSQPHGWKPMHKEAELPHTGWEAEGQRGSRQPSMCGGEAPLGMAGAAALARDNSGWQACLQLGFERRGIRSVCHERHHRGPLRVQRPFYPEGDAVCHVYMLHPPGGVVGGDDLEITVEVDSGAAALLTTPAAGKFYRSDGRPGRQSHRLRIAAGASLEWLPQETIVFAGAHAAMTNRVDLENDACFLGWEILCLGRPGAGERFESGSASQSWEIWRDGQALLIERTIYDPAQSALAAAWGLAGESVCGTLVCVGDHAACVDRIREAAAASNHQGLFSVSQLSAALVCRYLGPHSDEARSYFEQAWHILRPSVLRLTACAPRIWAT